MSEWFQKIRAHVSAAGLSAKTFYGANKGVVLSGLTLISILLIVWARLGFTFQLSKFYAAPVVQPSVLTVRCTKDALPVKLSWTVDPNAIENVLRKSRVPDTSTVVIDDMNVSSYVDSDLSNGEQYRYFVKSDNNVVSNYVDVFISNKGTCSIGVATPVHRACVNNTCTRVEGVGEQECSPVNSACSTPIPTPTATPTLTPTPTPSPSPSPTPTPTAVPASFTLAVSGQNVSGEGSETTVVQVRSNEQIRMSARFTVSDNSSAGVKNMIIRAVLPAGLAYVPGSTSVNGAPASVDSVTTGGIAIGTMGPGQTATVFFQAKVIGTAFPIGQSQAVISVQVGGDGVPAQTQQVTVIVTKSSGQVGTVQTGPGDAVVAALLVSGIMTLLYVSYTHSSAFRRREISTITETKDPMDFRS